MEKYKQINMPGDDSLEIRRKQGGDSTKIQQNYGRIAIELINKNHK
jgi:hypothetical protein